MRKLVLAPSIAAAVFAATSAYLALELNAARTELASARPASRHTDPVAVVARTSAAARAPDTTVAGPDAQSPAPHVMALSIDGPEQRQRLRNFLTTYRDPAGYESLFKD